MVIICSTFYNTRIVFNPHIFVTGRKISDQKVVGSTNNFTGHYPQISRQKSEDPAHILLSISILILFVHILKILEDFKTNKATGVDNLVRGFLNDCSNMVCTPIAKISIKLSSFPENSKSQKLSLFIKKSQN